MRLLKKGIILITLFSILVPSSAFAGAIGSYQKDRVSATVTVGADDGPSQTRSPGSSGQSGGNGGGQPAPPAWYQDLLDTAVIVGENIAQNHLQRSSGSFFFKDMDSPWSQGDNAGDPTRFQVNWTSNTTGEQIRNVIPLHWDWQFTNKSNGKTEYAWSGPLQRITRTFYDPGHYYVYYREYDKWETGYYTRVSGVTRVTVGDKIVDVPFSYSVWNSTGWHEGYLNGADFKYLLDFTLDNEQVGRLFHVEIANKKPEVRNVIMALVEDL